MAERDQLADGRRRSVGNLADQLASRVATARPEPPYTVLITDMIWGCFEIDRSRILPLMPKGLTPTSEGIAVVGMWNIVSGWGLAPSNGCFLGVPVAEYRSPDTAETSWVTGAYASGPARTLFDDQYVTCDPGAYRMTRADDLMSGSVVSGGKEIMRAVVRPTMPEVPGASSIDSYVGRKRTGEMTSFNIAVTGTVRAGEFVSFEITDDAPAALKALRPTALRWAMDIPFLPASWGIPQLLHDPPVPVSASRAALLELFDRYGRAACVVRTNGEIVHVNAEATRLAGADLALRGGIVGLGQRSDQSRLIAALASAAIRSSGSVPEHFAMMRADGRGTLIVQVAPVDPAIAGADAALVFLTDPAAPVRATPTETLQLLGLTPAEARAATLVGGGLPPREAASRLGIAEPTIRTQLRIAYEKLGITRQSELVQVVARLAFV